MMGCIPVIEELHKRLLKTFCNIIRKDNSIEKDIALRQLPFLANFALYSCRVSVPVASFTLTAAIVTANGSVPQLDQIL
jgi:hypothetical protein